MEYLAPKEEEMMNIFWDKGPMFVKEIMESYREMNKPLHSSTVTFYTHALENKCFLSHHTYGRSFQYYPVISRKKYQHDCLRAVIKKYFKDSYSTTIRMLVDNGDIALHELKTLVRKVEDTKK